MPTVSYSTMLRLSKALGNPHAVMGDVGESIDDRLIQLAIDRLDPVAAGEREFDSWREVMWYAREDRCPTGEIHDEDTSAVDPISGYYAVCRRCGHHTRLPF